MEYRCNKKGMKGKNANRHKGEQKDEKKIINYNSCVQ